MSERVGEGHSRAADHGGAADRGRAADHGGAGSHDDGGGGNAVKLAIAWTIVGVPLLYGISQTLIRASQLFTG